jgi:type II secretory pathway pseudopilin PulG
MQARHVANKQYRFPTRQFPARFGRRSRERGYVLLLCLIVIAISSSIVVTTFQVLKLHTAEASARRDLVNMAAIQSAGTEHALAHLIDQPTFRGGLGPFIIPNRTDQSYRIQIGDAGGDIQIDVVASVGSRLHTSTTPIRTADLDSRRQALGLAKPAEPPPSRQPTLPQR